MWPYYNVALAACHIQYDRFFLIATKLENLIYVFWSHDDMNHNYGKATIMDMENHCYMYNVRKIKGLGCPRSTSGNPKVC
jgi:hypothetical protein